MPLISLSPPLPHISSHPGSGPSLRGWSLHTCLCMDQTLGNKAHPGMHFQPCAPSASPPGCCTKQPAHSAPVPVPSAQASGTPVLPSLLCTCCQSLGEADLPSAPLATQLPVDHLYAAHGPREQCCHIPCAQAHQTGKHTPQGLLCLHCAGPSR